MSVPASLPPTRNFQAVSSHSVVLFFSLSLDAFSCPSMETHHHPPLEENLPLSLWELEGRDATGVGGNFPTEAFLSSRKCLFKLHRILCECKNCAHYTLGGFIVSFPKNPTLQVLHFLAASNSPPFFFFPQRENLGGNPQSFQEKQQN